MKLYKNVDIIDLNNILKDGILPISKTGNDNWSENKRSNNSKDVVYLFSEIDVKFVDVEFLVYSSELGEYILAVDEDKSIFVDTANLSTSDFNYLRGIKNNRMLDCQKKWRYMI